MKPWDILLSKESLKFLRKNHLSDTKAIDVIIIAIKKLSGDDINLDIKKLHPPYEGYFRIRTGKIRITFSIDFIRHLVDVVEINWRGSAYRK